MEYLWNLDLTGGVSLILIGYVTAKLFNARRITAMVLCILFVTFWDIIWVSFTDIQEDPLT
jgi:sugar phosphate permease